MSLEPSRRPFREGSTTRPGETTIAAGDQAEAVTRLKHERPGGYLLAHGGTRFARSLVSDRAGADVSDRGGGVRAEVRTREREARRGHGPVSDSTCPTPK